MSFILLYGEKFSISVQCSFFFVWSHLFAELISVLSHLRDLRHEARVLRSRPLELAAQVRVVGAREFQLRADVLALRAFRARVARLRQLRNFTSQLGQGGRRPLRGDVLVCVER